MNINIEVKKRHLVFILALFLIGGIYATVSHPWSEIDVPNEAISVEKLNPSGIGDAVKVTNPGGKEITIQQALYEAGGGIGPDSDITIDVGITGSTKSQDKYLKCPAGYAAVGMTFDSKRPDTLKCKKIAFNHFNCETVFASEDGGNKGANQDWKVDCPNNKVVTSIHCENYPDNTQFMRCYRLTDITCCESSFEVSDSEDGWADCDSLSRSSTEKGDQYAITGVYNKNDHFRQVDRVKYCKVSDWNPQ